MPAISDSAQLRAAMTVIESQRLVLGDAVVDAALVAMRAQLTALDAAPAAPPSV